MSDKPQQATPHQSLIDQIMDSRVAKNEREWACAIEIEKLQAKVQELEGKMNVTNKHDLIWLERWEVKRIEAEGIGDMLNQFDMKEMADCEGQYLSVNLMYEYKRQLESNNEK